MVGEADNVCPAKGVDKAADRGVQVMRQVFFGGGGAEGAEDGWKPFAHLVKHFSAESHGVADKSGSHCFEGADKWSVRGLAGHVGEVEAPPLCACRRR